LGLAILWAVKSSPVALAFPFFVLAMIPFRLLLGFIFTKVELDAVRFFNFLKKLLCFEN
jgi:hypothetical protein